MSLLEVEASYWVFPVMGIVSIVMAAFFYRKLRLLRRLSRDLAVTFFAKTFNVIDPFQKPRGTIQNFMLLALVLILYGLFLLGYVVVLIMQSGFLLGFALFILCFGLFMADAALELREGANTVIAGLKRRQPFGKGDVKAVLVLRAVLPKLSGYYLVVGVGLLGLFVVVPLVAPVALVAIAHAVGLAVEGSSSAGVGSMFLVLLIATVGIVASSLLAVKVKSEILGLPANVRMDSLGEQFERVHVVAQWAEKPPYELSHRPVVEDANVEDKKREKLDSEEE
jgi:hypothetical protein